MSRPAKSGLSYWPFDVDLFESKKYLLIKSEFGTKGEMIMIRIFNEVYRTDGYFKRWDFDDCLLLSQRLGDGCTPEFIERVVARCCERGLFDSGVFEKYGVITSREFQSRYIKVRTTHHDAIPVVAEYWLLSSTDMSEVSPAAAKKLLLRPLNAEINAGFTEDNGNGNCAEATRNALKQRKENKSKQKQSTSEQSTISAPTEAVVLSDAEQNYSVDAACGCGSAADENDYFADDYAEYYEQGYSTESEKNDCNAAFANVMTEFAKIRKPTEADRRLLLDMLGRKGERRLLEAVRETAAKGGRSAAYVARILDDPARQPMICSAHDKPEYSNHVEDLMFAEWFGDELYGEPL